MEEAPELEDEEPVDAEDAAEEPFAGRSHQEIGDFQWRSQGEIRKYRKQ